MVVILTGYVLRLTILGYENAPNLDETAHLSAGYSHWQFGDFSLYSVNPPLIRTLATIPLLVDRPMTDWSTFGDSPFSRAEFRVGIRFNAVNRERTFWYFALARWSLIPVSLLGAYVAYRWSYELFGPSSGVVAVTLWCFCPNLIAWGASITPDAGAASFGVLAAWRFWKWLKAPILRNALTAGFALGLAELTKSTWIILFGLWPIMWCVSQFGRRCTTVTRPSFRQLLLILCVALYLLNLWYGFERTGEQLKEFNFISETLGGRGAHEAGGNRFRDSWVGKLPVPVPANYLRGIDIQRYDFEVGKWSYLRGEQKKGGWWYYYLYAILVKMPVGFLALVAVASVLFVTCHTYRAEWRDEFVLILPGLAILLLVSSQTGFNRHLRYALPAFPFLYVFSSRVAVRFGQRKHRWSSAFVAVSLALGVVSSVSVFPHSVSYFNLLVGGPEGGKDHLLDSNIDWGQDLLRLKRWSDEHPEASPLYLAVLTHVPLDTIGISGEQFPGVSSSHDGLPRSPQPGWYAISVNELMGYRHYGTNRAECMQFQALEPVDTIGYSIYIYRIEAKDTAPDPEFGHTNEASVGLPME